MTKIAGPFLCRFQSINDHYIDIFQIHGDLWMPIYQPLYDTHGECGKWRERRSPPCFFLFLWRCVGGDHWRTCQVMARLIQRSTVFICKSRCPMSPWLFWGSSNHVLVITLLPDIDLYRYNSTTHWPMSASFWFWLSVSMLSDFQSYTVLASWIINRLQWEIKLSKWRAWGLGSFNFLRSWCNVSSEWGSAVLD